MADQPTLVNTPTADRAPVAERHVQSIAADLNARWGPHAHDACTDTDECGPDCFVSMVREVLDLAHGRGLFGPATTDHQPMRGDAVEAWIKHRRDQHGEAEDAYWELDGMLDEFRLRSDTGTSLGQPTHTGEAA